MFIIHLGLANFFFFFGVVLFLEMVIINKIRPV